MSNPSPIPFRIGHGYDLHRLKVGGELWVGGVLVSNEISPIAHSDGDVVIHALVDALMGALCWGDIGERFPNTDPRWKDVRSEVFLKDVWDAVTRAGWQLGNMDITILAERPKLKKFKPAMADALARMTGCTPTQFNLKAGTNEGCDAIGQGQAIAAHAVVLLTR